MATASELAAQFAIQAAPYNAQRQQARNNLDYTQKNLTQNRDDSQRQEYLSYMQAQRQTPQILRAEGAHGGMMGSQARRLENSYANNRQGNDTTFSRGMSDAEMQYANQMAEINAMLSAIEAAKAAAMSSAVSSYGGGGSSTVDDSTYVPAFMRPKAPVEDNTDDRYNSDYAGGIDLGWKPPKNDVYDGRTDSVWGRK